MLHSGLQLSKGILKIVRVYFVDSGRFSVQIEPNNSFVRTKNAVYRLQGRRRSVEGHGCIPSSPEMTKAIRGREFSV
jgi:hypothetical protein